MVTTSIDVARVAGVSRTTVMRALKNKPDISAETKARIKQIAADMKYRPNYIARRLCMGKSKHIGVCISPTAFRSFPQIAITAQRKLERSGYGLLYYTSVEATPQMEANSIEHMMQSQVEGVLAAPGPNAPAGAYRDLVDSGAKLVIFDGYIEGLDVPQISVDHYKAGRLAIEHLVSLGRRNIVYLAIPQTLSIGKERMQGVVDAMNGAGIPVTPETIVEIDSTEDAAAAITGELLARPNRPDAIYARHDVVAYGAMRAILSAGLSIPGDIALVGSGDLVDDDILRVPLTTVAFEGHRSIEIAIDTLLKMLKGGRVKPARTVLDVKLVVRDSTTRIT